MLIICIKTTINCESEETAFSKLSKHFDHCLHFAQEA